MDPVGPNEADPNQIVHRSRRRTAAGDPVVADYQLQVDGLESDNN